MSKLKRKRKETNTSSTPPIDPLDAAETLLVELLRHTAATTTQLAHALQGNTTNDDDDEASKLPIDFNMKTFQLERLLTNECRQLTGATPTAAESKRRILSELDTSLDEQETDFFQNDLL